MNNYTSILNVVKLVVDLLNPNNVLQLTNKIIALRAKNANELELMARTIHKKALSKPNSAVSYAQLCASMINGAELNPSVPRKNQILFKKSLLSMCFENFYTYSKDNRTLRTKSENMPTFYSDLNKSQLEQYNLYLANCIFNAELYNQGVLSEKCIWDLITNLLKENGDLQVHCLCTLLKISGSKLSKTYSMAKSVAHLLILENNSFREIVMSTILRPIIRDITEMYFDSWIHEDPDQSITKGSRFKYRQETLAVQLMTEFIYKECYNFLINFIEETDSDGNNDIIEQLSPIVLCLLKNDQSTFVVSLIHAALYENIQIRLKATNILIKLFRAKHLSKMMVFLGFDKLYHDEKVNACSLKYVINDIKDDFKNYMNI